MCKDTLELGSWDFSGTNKKLMKKFSILLDFDVSFKFHSVHF